jgi:hypothetical protein
MYASLTIDANNCVTNADFYFYPAQYANKQIVPHPHCSPARLLPPSHTSTHMHSVCPACVPPSAPSCSAGSAAEHAGPRTGDSGASGCGQQRQHGNHRGRHHRRRHSRRHYCLPRPSQVGTLGFSLSLPVFPSDPNSPTASATDVSSSPVAVQPDATHQADGDACAAPGAVDLMLAAYAADASPPKITALDSPR